MREIATAAAGLDYVDKDSISDHEFDNPIYSIESQKRNPIATL